MVQIATEVENSAAHRDPLTLAAAHLSSSYTEAMDTVSTNFLQCRNESLTSFSRQIHLTETFLGFAESLRKPRASLMRGVI
jgi:hypothetical protein